MAQAVRTRTTAVQKKVADIAVGDKLLTDIIGYKGRVLLYRGQTMSVKEITWLKKKLAEKQPEHGPQKYLVGRKTPGKIMDKDGKVLVERGKEITVEALAPLLKEGFKIQETFDGGKLFFKSGEWPKDQPWHIDQFNPAVTVESTAIVPDEDLTSKGGR